MAMTLKVTVTKECTRVLNSKEVATTDLDAVLDEMVMECNKYGTVVDVQKDQLVG